MLTFANRDVCTLIAKDYTTKTPFLNWPYANMTAVSASGEAVYAYGGQGHPKRVPFYGERGGTLTIETQMQAMELFKFMTGADVETTAEIQVREELQATRGVITITGTPVEGSVFVFKLDDDCGTPVECSTEGSNVTLSGESSSSNDKFIVYYLKTESTGVKKVTLKSTTFPKAAIISAETYYRTEDDMIVPYYVTAYKAAPQPNFELSFSNTGDPATITITCDLLVDDQDRVLDMTIIEDAA